MSDIAQIKVDLRNRTSMYNNAKSRNDILKDEIIKLKSNKIELENIISSQKDDIERMQHTIDEYKRMIFRPSKKLDSLNTLQENHEEIWVVKSDTLEHNNKTKRDKDSYIRKIPHPSKITHVREVKIDKCPVCKNPLFDIKKIERFVEDISFKDIEPKITKYVIHSWYCKFCKKQRSLEDIPKAVTMFWENIRMFVNWSYTILKLSYEVIKTVLKTLYNFEISDWEITNILQREAEILTPEYNQIKEWIQKQFWVHFDESAWNVQTEKERNYAWCMTWTQNNDVIYDIWISRWAWEINVLGWIEENKNHIWISDWYPWYINKFGIHQLCWAHPNRKLRDLTESTSLDKDKLERCKITYISFNKLYLKVNKEMESEQVRIGIWKPSSEKQREKLKKTLLKQFLKITRIHKNDPKKLRIYKESLIKYQDKYFVCILNPWIPSDNNKAERALRHLVLKRKMCNWSKTKQAASFMSINFSVLLSTFWKHPNDFFEDYRYMRDLYFKDPTIEERLKRELKI